MKTCFTYLIFIAIVESNAQNATSSIRDSIDAVFSTLNNDSINTGILLNKCMPLFDIEKYNSINDTLTNFNVWRGLYRSMYLGSFNRSVFISDDSINHILQSSREVDVIPIFILNYNYNSFKPCAVDSNPAAIYTFTLNKSSYL